MRKEELKTNLQGHSFRSFKVRVAGDGEYDVASGDHVSLHPNRRLLFIHLDSRGTAIVDVPLISFLRVKETV